MNSQQPYGEVSASNAAEVPLEELRSNAVTRGSEWLRGALGAILRDELRALVAAGKAEAWPNKKWLLVAELRGQLMEVLSSQGLLTQDELRTGL